ncbi:MAG: hypothetical protein GY711_19140 [bacterium]|nr:hypothetical protein [bacterium]
MKLRSPGIWLSALSLLLIVAVAANDLERTSPGPLSATHAQVAELDGGRRCDACHGGWLRSMNSSCNACHEEIEEQVAAARGLHGVTLEVDPAACEECHSEHRGAEFRLVSPASFTLAGLEREAFDHGHVDFDLGGRHAELTCAECHPRADDHPLAPGTQRFLGLDQDCESCHDDPHEGGFARTCDSCHGQEHAFEEIANFVHVESFPLDGSHARPVCAECHVEDSGYEIEDLAGFEPRPPDRTCEDCHDDSPHRDTFVDGVAALTLAERGDTCGLCHQAAQESFAGDSTFDVELHAASGFALDEPHVDLGCVECHSEDGEFAERHPGRERDDCAACHEDPHAGQFADAGCIECHRETHFFPSLFDLDAHAETAFPLEAGHTAVSCGACHLGDVAEGTQLFTETSTTCATCHEEAHQPAFDDSSGCAECHGTTTFDDVDGETFDHGSWTPFALDGAHLEARCEACHPRAARADALGRRFGRVAAVFGEPTTSCATCHADPHDEAFAGESCDACHSTAHFTELVVPFDHGAKTGFALTGAHLEAECAECHGTYPEPAVAGRTLGRVSQVFSGSTERCETCHADIHEGAFDGPDRPALVEQREGCERCHTPTAFDDILGSFDHGLWAGYALEGAHAELDCAACHTSGAGDVLGPAAGTDCAACHAEPHVGQFLEDGRTDCARCHLETTWLEELSFDHGTDARFALDEAHEQLPCSVCHVPWPLADGSEAVRYKPLGTLCIECHDHGGGEQQ